MRSSTPGSRLGPFPPGKDETTKAAFPAPDVFPDVLGSRASARGQVLEDEFRLLSVVIVS